MDDHGLLQWRDGALSVRAQTYAYDLVHHTWATRADSGRGQRGGHGGVGQPDLGHGGRGAATVGSYGVGVGGYSSSSTGATEVTQFCASKVFVPAVAK